MRKRIVMLGVTLGCLGCWAPARAGAQVGRPEQLAPAESALAARDVNRAVQLATAYTNRYRDDPKGWIVLGRARAARGTGSAEHRLQAIWAFRRAGELDPANTDVWDGCGRIRSGTR